MSTPEPAAATSRPVPPIVVTIVAPWDPATAFRRFTEELGRWWPREYTWSGDVLEELVMEPHLGGMCIERGPHGFRCDWGRIVRWEPPRVLEITWQVGPRREPVPDPARATVVTVRFHSAASNRTEVTLQHREFERHCAEGTSYRDALASSRGWPYILSRFTEGEGPTAS